MREGYSYSINISPTGDLLAKSSDSAWISKPQDDVVSLKMLNPAILLNSVK
jgi:hypothetical protein